MSRTNTLQLDAGCNYASNGVPTCMPSYSTFPDIREKAETLAIVSDSSTKRTRVLHVLCVRAVRVVHTFQQQMCIGFSRFSTRYDKIDVSNHTAARFWTRLDPKDVSMSYRLAN